MSQITEGKGGDIQFTKTIHRLENFPLQLTDLNSPNAKMESSKTTLAVDKPTADSVPEESKPVEIKSWADVAEEPEEVPETPDMKDLAIDEFKRRNQTLSDPDDSSIEAVCNLFSPDKLYLLFLLYPTEYFASGYRCLLCSLSKRGVLCLILIFPPLVSHCVCLIGFNLD